MGESIKNRGITLIALIITIIILLILAGVSIQMVIGKNGTVNNAFKAVKLHDLESEREALGLAVVSWQDKKDDSSRLGNSLVDRNLVNSSSWDIMVQDSTTYGSGWNYVEKGTDLGDYGKADYDWLINYDTGEVKLVEGKYNHFTYLSTLAVKDNLVVNLDSANIFLNDLSSIGKNATLYYYEPDNSDKTDEEKYKEKYYEQVNQYGHVDSQNKGYDRQKSENINDYIDPVTNAFKFNGNDYIEIYDPSGFNFEKGLTYEFYGNLEGTRYLKINGGNERDKNFCGLFAFWSGRYDIQPIVRFGYNFHCDINGDMKEPYKSCLWYSLDTKSGEYHGGSWDFPGYGHNQVCELEDLKDENAFFTITIDPVGLEDVKQTIYLNGEKYKEGYLKRYYFNDFLDKAKDLKYLELGRCSMGAKGNWAYQVGLSYTTRIYNRALTSDEVKANMDVTKAFHEYLIEENARNGIK